MTVLEAHIAFKIEADKNAVNIGISGCPSFLPEEIDYWLYTAYLSKLLKLLVTILLEYHLKVM